jgi:cell division septation protein DedD
MAILDKATPEKEQEVRSFVKKKLDPGMPVGGAHHKTTPEQGPAVRTETESRKAPERSAAPPQPQQAVEPSEKVLEPEPESDPPFPFSVYLGSFRTLKRAEKAVALYGEKGFSPYWTKISLPEKGEWFRVFTGTFSERGQAERFIQDQGLEGAAVRKTEYANLIGSYADREDLQREMGKLKELGYTPYVVESREGVSRLFVGAFTSEKRAGLQQTELKAKGIENRTVLR